MPSVAGCQLSDVVLSQKGILLPQKGIVTQRGTTNRQSSDLTAVYNLLPCRTQRKLRYLGLNGVRILGRAYHGGGHLNSDSQKQHGTVFALSVAPWMRNNLSIVPYVYVYCTCRDLTELSVIIAHIDSDCDNDHRKRYSSLYTTEVIAKQ